MSHQSLFIYVQYMLIKSHHKVIVITLANDTSYNMINIYAQTDTLYTVQLAQ